MQWVSGEISSKEGKLTLGFALVSKGRLGTNALCANENSVCQSKLDDQAIFGNDCFGEDAFCSIDIDWVEPFFEWIDVDQE